MHNGDAYGGYNKPEAVREWLDHVEPESDTVRLLRTRLQQLISLHMATTLETIGNDVLNHVCSQCDVLRPRWHLHRFMKRRQVLVLDTDLIIRTPFLPAQLHVRHGFARSAEFAYMKGAWFHLSSPSHSRT